MRDLCRTDFQDFSPDQQSKPGHCAKQQPRFRLITAIRPGDRLAFRPAPAPAGLIHLRAGERLTRSLC